MIDPNKFGSWGRERIIRGDERLHESRISVKGKFCLVHGSTAKLITILADGEVYLACEWCVANSPSIQVDDAEMDIADAR